MSQQAIGFLANVVQTVLIDPKTHNTTNSAGGRIAIFEIPKDTVYLPQMQLIGLGATKTGGTNVQYPRSSGIAELIDSISIELNGTTLAVIEDFSSYAAKKHLEAPNQHLMQYQSVMSRTELGVQRRWHAPSNPWGTDGAIRHGYRPSYLRNFITDSASTTAKGILMLNDYFDFLNVVPYFPPLSNFLLKIVWKDLRPAGTLRYDANITDFSNLQPMLVMKKIINPSPEQLVPSLPTLVFDGIVTEYKQVPATTNGTAQTVSLELQSLVSLDCRDLTWATYPATDERRMDAGFGKHYSAAQKGEVFSFTINGSRWLPYNGIDGMAVKQYFKALVDGGIAAFYDSYNYDAEAKRNEYDESMLYTVGRLSYGGMPYGGFISTNTLTYQRVGDESNDTQLSALTIQLWGKAKQFVTIRCGKPVTGQFGTPANTSALPRVPV